MLGLFYRLCDGIRKRARYRHLHPDHAAGLEGEDLAHRFLRKLGYTVLARNYRGRRGGYEVDLVALDGSTIVFVEVKTRRGEEFGAPERAIDDAKREHIARAAADFLARSKRSGAACRFDVVSVVLGPPRRMRHARGLFTPPQAI